MEFCREHLLGDGAPDTQKKRTQAVAEKGMVHPQAERGVRRSDGGTCWTFITKSTTGSVRWCVFDESSKQLLGDVRPPIAAAPGRVERYDTEYQRNGTRNLFMFCEPKGGWRHIEVDRAPDCCGLRSTDEVAGGRGIS